MVWSSRLTRPHPNPSYKPAVQWKRAAAHPLRPYNSSTDGVEQPGVRKKSLYPGDTSDTNLSLLNQVTQPIVRLFNEWAKVALDTFGTSEARMSTPVWPSVFANSQPL